MSFYANCFIEIIRKSLIMRVGGRPFPEESIFKYFGLDSSLVFGDDGFDLIYDVLIRENIISINNVDRLIKCLNRIGQPELCQLWMTYKDFNIKNKTELVLEEIKSTGFLPPRMLPGRITEQNNDFPLICESMSTDTVNSIHRKYYYED